LGAPKGSAFLYVRPECQSLIEPLIVSWGWQSETPGPSRFVDEQEWTGTRDIAAYLATPAAIAFQRDYAWEAVRADCHALAAETQRRVSALSGLPPLSSPAWFAQMVSLPLPPCAGAALKARLYDEYRVEVPVVTWQQRQLLRVSIQGYNTPADVDHLLDGLRALLSEVRR
jgi:isopenicillin-N epimerase